MSRTNEHSVKRGAPLVFEDAGKLFRPDSCEVLKEAAAHGDISVEGWARGNYPGVRIPSGVLPGVRSLGMWNAATHQNWGLGEHCNEGLEISFLSHGNLSFSSVGQECLLRPGDVTVTAPWLVHEVGLPHVEASRLIWIILDVGVRRPNQSWEWPDWVLLSDVEKASLTDILQNDDRTVWHSKSMAAAFERLAAQIQSCDITSIRTHVKIEINTILLCVVQTVATERTNIVEPRDKSTETVRLFLGRLEEHIDYHWRIEDMAKQCGMSRGSFIQRCRELVNCTPHAFLLQLRLSRAKALIAEHDQLSLTDIAFQCGFSSSAHFSTAFKKATKQTPSMYRDRHVQCE